MQASNTAVPTSAECEEVAARLKTIQEDVVCAAKGLALKAQVPPLLI